jgi:hypothetical protein
MNCNNTRFNQSMIEKGVKNLYVVRVLICTLNLCVEMELLT